MTSDLGTGFRRTLKKLTASSADLEIDELQRERVSQGCQQIASIDDRDVVTVYGHVKNVSLAPRAGTPTLEAAVYDGSGILTLVWLGRRRIAGIEPGTNLVASGRVSCQDGRRVMYNPHYQLQA